jgi:hypothetical protein
MNAATVTGYAFDADTYCAEHCDEDSCESHPAYVDPPSPIFASDEFDYQPYCRTCGEAITVNLITCRT